ncbi:MAG: putative Ca2+-binding protein [Rhodobacteraceae bacterium HLUCCA08]|nr:MAG: putative Ca2+-binding protein [Rhodobacteraceae bacterium HLUCCA08]
MTTYSLTTWAWQGDFGAPTELIGPTTLDFVMPDTNTDFFYRTLGTTPAGYPVIAPETGAWTIRLDGTILLSFDGNGPEEITILAIDWDDGGTARTSYALNIHLPDTQVDYLVGIGRDALPEFSDFGAFEGWFARAALSAPAAGSGFGESDPITYDRMPDATRTDDDDVVGGPSDGVYDLGPGDDVIEAGDGDDTIYAGSGFDQLFGGDGEDYLYLDTDRGIAYGGEERDYIHTPQSHLTDAGPSTLYGGGGNDQLYVYDYDTVAYGGEGNDVIHGDGSFFGNGSGDVTFFGGAGDDYLVPGSGETTFYGGEGNDYLVLSTANGSIEFYQAFTGRDIGGGFGVLHIYDISHVYGGGYADRIVGDRASTDFFYVDAGGGDDLIKGGGGQNSLRGGNGDDRILGNEDSDILDGMLHDDTVFGLGGNDTVRGGPGDDFLYGGRGDDTVIGGADNDVLRGNRGDDRLLAEAGDDDARGGAGHDTIDGGEGDDFLVGENGNDVLRGGKGDDVLIGGFGGAAAGDGLTDIFRFHRPEIDGGWDRIKDFEDGIDQLQFIGWSFTDFTTDLYNRASDTVGGMRIDFGGGDVIFLENFDKADFDETDVIF